MSKIRFPKSNSLRFIRTEDNSLLQSDDTRLYFDFDYTSISNSCYFQKVQQSHGLWVQYRTDYFVASAFLVKNDGTETDISSEIISATTISNGTTQYELTVDLTGITGYYCIRFDFNQDAEKPIATFQSEWFEVAASFDDCLLFESKNGSSPTNNDGMVWGSETQKFLIESSIVDYIPGVKKSTFTAENQKLLTTEAHPIKTKRWFIELIPDYMIELINIAMSKEYFYINSVRYNSEDTLDVERQGETRLYSASVNVMVVEDHLGIAYEDYTDDAELTGTLPVFSNEFIMINDTEFLIINDTGDNVKINN